MLVTPTLDGDIELPEATGSSSHLVPSPKSTSSTVDPHDSKLPPDHPGLEIKRAPIRVLRKGPITAIGLVTIVLAVTALGRGFLAGDLQNSSSSGQAGKTAEPQAPAASNLQVADLVKNAPDNHSPVLVHTSKPPVAHLSEPPSSDMGPLGAAIPPDGGVSATPRTAVPANAVRPPRETRRQLLERINAAGLYFKNDGAEPGGGGGGGGKPQPALAPEQLPPPGYAGTVPPGTAAPPSGDLDPNGQAAKNAFLKDSAKAQSTYVASRVTPPATQYELLAGDIIPATLITGINSDLPGQVIARVTRNIRDTVSREILLIPQGSTLVGRYDSSVVYGQDRVLLCWQRLIRPDGSSLNLECAPAVDQGGMAGIADQVDNHWGKIITGVVLSSLLSATTQAAAGDVQGYRPNLAQSWAAGAAGEIGAAGQQITRRNLAVQPTIKIRPGFSVNVLVSKDLILTPCASPIE